MDLAKLTAKEVMTADVLMAYEGWSIKRLSEFFMKNGISGAPVIASDHSLVGVVTASDVINFESKSQQEKNQLVEEVYAEFVGTFYDEVTIQELVKNADESCTVNRVMTPKVVQVSEDALIPDIAKMMMEEGIRRIFVTRNGIMCGVITPSNLLNAIAQL